MNIPPGVTSKSTRNGVLERVGVLGCAICCSGTLTASNPSVLVTPWQPRYCTTKLDSSSTSDFFGFRKLPRRSRRFGVDLAFNGGDGF